MFVKNVLIEVCKQLLDKDPIKSDNFYCIVLKDQCTKKNKQFYKPSEIINNSEKYKNYIVSDIKYGSDCTTIIYAEYIIHSLFDLISIENNRIVKECVFIDVLGSVYDYESVTILTDDFKNTNLVNYDVNDDNQIVRVRFIIT